MATSINIQTIWQSRPDLQAEFATPTAKGKSGNWTMKDWYERYGKNQESQPTETIDDPDTQRAYGVWKTRPDLQAEFSSFDGKGKSGNWTVKDWYSKYGKVEYADPAKNFFGLKINGVDDWDKHIANMKFGYDWGKTGVGGYMKPDTNEIFYNNKLIPEYKIALINHEIGHYLTKSSSEKELNDLFGDAGQKHPKNLLVERAAVAYAGYKSGNIKDKKWIKYFKDLEDKNYK